VEHPPVSDPNDRFGVLEERQDEVALERRPFDQSTPPDAPCRLCCFDVAQAEAPVLRRGRYWYCSATCADEMDPLEAA
jgi:hypothetical protein